MRAEVKVVMLLLRTHPRQRKKSKRRRRKRRKRRSWSWQKRLRRRRNPRSAGLSAHDTHTHTRLFVQCEDDVLNNSFYMQVTESAKKKKKKKKEKDAEAASEWTDSCNVERSLKCSCGLDTGSDDGQRAGSAALTFVLVNVCGPEYLFCFFLVVQMKPVSPGCIHVFERFFYYYCKYRNCNQM